MRAARRVGAGAAALAAVLLLAGCVRLVNVTVSQSPLAPVGITVEVCAVNSTSCPQGNLALNAVDGVGQVLLGFRVPAATTDPDSFTSSTPSGVLTFARNAGYTAELERLSPAGPGRRWAGYVSNPVNYADDSGPQSFKATASWTLRQAADGAPFVRPFRYRVVAGSRTTSASKPPTRAVVCAAGSLGVASDGDTTICVDSPALSALSSDLEFASRDAGVLAANAKATAVPGALAAVPFTIRYSGPGGDDAPRLNLSASTTLPGAKVAAAPNVAIPPTDGSVKALVTVEVPAGAKPGDYEVRLTATPPFFIIRPNIPIGPIATANQVTPNPRSRTGVGRLTVAPAPSGPGGPGGPGGATLTLSKTTAKVTFSRSRPRGFVQIEGNASRGALLNVLLQRLGAAGSKGRVPPVTRSVFRTVRVKAGKFRTRVAVAPGFLPGRYRVRVAPLTVDNVALPLRTASVRLRAPRKGVVDSAYVSDRKRGSAIRRFPEAPVTIFANFRFAPGALPAAGRRNRISVRWFRNNRAVTPATSRPRKKTLSTFLRLRSKRPLPAGRYKAVLRVGGTAVGIASTRIG